ncbi:YgaP family membrane protein [Paenibacillus xerothermodurans]|uniref:DUF2892 domain-containing protein n=1 Tax=Paenibacillus xerothermodurans TaxID=1977292 RepID=A0A2W1N8U1_PAEXE|nr:DUF2892 domain-containing protein [Paenibacillus xerothermodurans]PZE19551.1 DUF2892 domain-containing protein [Paenibacillus xerothermodurans]
MKCNVGNTERIVRMSIGGAIMLSGLYYRRWWGLLGLAPILTGAFRYCPANNMLGLDNCQRKNTNIAMTNSPA